MPASARALALAVLLATQGAGMGLSHELDQWVRGLGGTGIQTVDGQVTAIDLNRSWVSDLDLERLAGLTSLVSLRLAQTHISDGALEIVATLPNLQELDLFYCEHITDSGAAILRKVTKLRSLNVRGTKISDSGLKFLTELQELETLNIGITEVSDSSVDLLESLPNLKSLAIGGNKISEVGITGLRALKQLRELDLSGGQVTDSGIWAVTVTDLNIGEIGALSELRSLNLAAPSPEYVDAISTGVPRLRGKIRVSDFGVVQLAQLTNLRLLNLSRSHLTAKGVQSLQALAGLEELILSHVTTLGDGTGAALAGLPSLKVLDVSFTQFGDADLAALRDHPRIRRIVAASTPIGDNAAAEFVAAGDGRDLIR